MSYTEKDLEEFKERTLKPTDTFTFTCKMCGNCCRNRQIPIMLTGVDTYYIAKALGKKVDQTIVDKARMIMGADSHIPIFVLKERSDGSCSLLKKGKCMVHEDGKPCVCKLYPLGRYFGATDGKEHYFTQPNACGEDGGKVWTLQEWLDEFHIEDNIEDVKVWTKFLMGVVSVTHKIPNNKMSSAMRYTLVKYMYGEYDINKPYIEQAEANMIALQKEFKEKYNLKVEYK